MARELQRQKAALQKYVLEKIQEFFTVFSNSLACFWIYLAIVAVMGVRYNTSPMFVHISFAFIFALNLMNDARQWCSLSAHIRYRVCRIYCAFFDTLQNADTFLHILYVVTSLLGMFVHPTFYAFNLLDIINMSETLTNVVKAVTLPARQLGMTFVLMVIVIYMISFIAFALSPVDFVAGECTQMESCFLAHMHYGMLFGGGIGDYLAGEQGTLGMDSGGASGYLTKDNVASRIIYEMAFFIIVIVLMMNIVFGIIVDTFGELRDEHNQRDNFLRQFCFMCGLNRSVFDANVSKGSTNYDNHIASEHNLWDYVFFLIYLEHKDEDEYTGVETYVSAKILDDDITWIPNETSMCLEQLLESAEREEGDETACSTNSDSMVTKEVLAEMLSSLENKLLNRLSAIEE